MKRRVVITGMGCLSPLGNDVASFWAGVSAGQCAIAPLDYPLAGQGGVATFAPVRPYDASGLDHLDPVAQIAVLASRQAVAQAGLPPGRVAVAIGSSMGGRTSEDEIARGGQSSPDDLSRIIGCAPTMAVAAEHGCHGPSFSTNTACASANHAIGLAMMMIRAGAADAALAGGAEICRTFSVLKSWEALRVLSPDLCRPFCAERRGPVLGEGAGILLLEEREAALARGAPILAELAGFGMTGDAGDIVRPLLSGTIAAIAAALADAGLAPEEIDYINAHGTGTQVNDSTETAAIRAVFGDHADRLSVSSTKSMIGHSLGASGALELIATVRALQEGLLPPTANFGTPSPDCDLDYIPNQARRRPIAAALSNSFGFGGVNAVLAVRRAEL